MCRSKKLCTSISLQWFFFYRHVWLISNTFISNVATMTLWVWTLNKLCCKFIFGDGVHCTWSDSCKAAILKQTAPDNQIRCKNRSGKSRADDYCSKYFTYKVFHILSTDLTVFFFFCSSALNLLNLFHFWSFYCGGHSDVSGNGCASEPLWSQLLDEYNVTFKSRDKS